MSPFVSDTHRIVLFTDLTMFCSTYFAQGTLEQRQEDYESAEKSFRKAGSSWIKDDKNLHPFYGGCMYKIGLCCLKQGKTEEAM